MGPLFCQPPEGIRGPQCPPIALTVPMLAQQSDNLVGRQSESPHPPGATHLFPHPGSQLLPQGAFRSAPTHLLRVVTSFLSGPENSDAQKNVLTGSTLRVLQAQTSLQTRTRACDTAQQH